VFIFNEVPVKNLRSRQLHHTGIWHMVVLKEATAHWPGKARSYADFCGWWLGYTSYNIYVLYLATLQRSYCGLCWGVAMTELASVMGRSTNALESDLAGNAFHGSVSVLIWDLHSRSWHMPHAMSIIVNTSNASLYHIRYPHISWGLRNCIHLFCAGAGNFRCTTHVVTREHSPSNFRRLPKGLHRVALQCYIVHSWQLCVFIVCCWWQTVHIITVVAFALLGQHVGCCVRVMCGTLWVVNDLCSI
jgi:hypothetical protein